MFASQTEGELKVTQVLKEKFPRATAIQVTDISGKAFTHSFCGTLLRFSRVFVWGEAEVTRLGGGDLTQFLCVCCFGPDGDEDLETSENHKDKPQLRELWVTGSSLAHMRSLSKPAPVGTPRAQVKVLIFKIDLVICPPQFF